MASLEQQLIEKIIHLDLEKQRLVLEFVEQIENSPEFRTYSARELRLLPQEARDRLIAEAFKAAADEDFEIFEAYSEEILV